MVIQVTSEITCGVKSLQEEVLWLILSKTVSLTGGSNRPSNSQLSQQYRTELNTLDVLLSQTVRLKHRVSRCTRLTFYSLFFSCCYCLAPVCPLPTLLSSSLISFLSPPCPPPPPPLQSTILCAIFTFSCPALLSSSTLSSAISLLFSFFHDLSVAVADASLPFYSACSHDTYLLPVRLLLEP